MSPTEHKAAVITLHAYGTSAHAGSLGDVVWLAAGPTSSSEAGRLPFAPEPLDSGTAVLELRRLTGLTWDQLARLLGVARRSLHFWASGKPLNARNEEQVYRTLDTVRSIDRGSAAENRALLLRECGGRVPFDLLAGQQYGEVVELVGTGPGRARPRLLPLGDEARAPQPPEELTGALHDRVAETAERRKRDK